MAETLGLSEDEFYKFSRIRSERCKLRDASFENKQRGKRTSRQLCCSGRVALDMMVIVKMEQKLRSYTLNYVSEHILKQRKDDVSHTMISSLWESGPEGCAILCRYCMKDATLPRLLMDKLCVISRFAEMARVCGVPVQYLLQRGQQIKVMSQLLTISHEQPTGDANPYIIPYIPVNPSDDKYEGAIVVQPKRGFYNVPLATLDFNSLYPSIMIAHNLCYTTFLSEAALKENPNMLEGLDYFRSPLGHCFMSETRQPGILTTILQRFLAKRKAAKKELFHAEEQCEYYRELLSKDPPNRKEAEEQLKSWSLRASVMDGRQLALKISANSVYGFTGATRGVLPLLPISASVTAYGRQMIELTIRVIEERFTRAYILKEYGIETAHDTYIVYGDTDSVMINFGVKTPEESMRIAVDAAGVVNQHFKKPINLDFEKVYYPYLLINKKRYIGGFYVPSGKPPRITFTKIDAKGVEIVRRDNCLMVSEMLKRVSEILMKDRNEEDAIKHVVQTIYDLKMGRVPISKLIISKGLKDAYKAAQPHVTVVRKMRERDIASAPRLGDRVPYVIIQGTKKEKPTDRAEDPLYAIAHQLPLDIDYYLKNQMRKPIVRFFGPILAKRHHATPDKSLTSKGKEVDMETQLWTLYEKLCDTYIFNLPQLSIVRQRTQQLAAIEAPTPHGIGRFCEIKKSCRICHTLSLNGRSICDACEGPHGRAYRERMIKSFEAMKIQDGENTDACIKCQGGDSKLIEACANRDCPIFYARVSTRKELAQLGKDIEDLQLKNTRPGGQDNNNNL